MKLAQAFRCQGLDEIKALLDDGILRLYSVARPPSPDAPIIRSGLLATFEFASPAFNSDAADALACAVFASNPVIPEGTGTPGFARAYSADGITAIADFSVGPGDTDIKLSAIATTPGFPVAMVALKLQLPAA